MQQVVKKNILTYRTNVGCEKPVSNFSSTTSLGPLQTQQMLGPGQKFQQHQKFAKKSKSIVNSTDNLQASSMSSKSANMPLKAAPSTSKFTVCATVETPILKLTKVEEKSGT